jgi:hypothetical protein
MRVAAGGAGGLEERDGEEGALAAAAGARAHLDREALRRCLVDDPGGSGAGEDEREGAWFGGGPLGAQHRRGDYWWTGVRG